MSASICWEPVNPTPECVPGIGAPDYFMETLEAAFGSGRPWDFDAEDIPTLRGLAAASARQFHDEKVNPYTYLINRINQHKAIRVWPEY